MWKRWKSTEKETEAKRVDLLWELSRPLLSSWSPGHHALHFCAGTISGTKGALGYLMTLWSEIESSWLGPEECAEGGLLKYILQESRQNLFFLEPRGIAPLCSVARAFCALLRDWKTGIVCQPSLDTGRAYKENKAKKLCVRITHSEWGIKADGSTAAWYRHW